MAVQLETLSAEAQREAIALGLRSPYRDLPPGLDFAAWFAVVEENFRALSVAECRAVFERYQGEDVGDLDRFRECNAVYCFDPTIERHCLTHLDALDGILKRRVELFLGYLLQFKVAGNTQTADLLQPLESRFLKFRGQVGGETRSFGQLNQLIKSSTDRTERQAAYEAFLPLARENRDEVLALIATRNRLAESLGYRDFFDLRFKHSEIDEAWFLSMLDALETATQAPYEAACRNIRQSLGIDAVMPWDVARGVENLTPLPPETFSEERAERCLRRLLTGWGFSEAEANIPLYQCGNFTMGGLCFGIEPGKEVAILISPVNGPRYYRTYFHEHGHAMHFRHAGQGNILLNVEDMAFNEGMAVFFESFVSDPAWVRQNLELSELDQVKYCLQARYASLTWMRTLLVNIRFEHALYTREGEDMDAIYLELQQRCGGFDLPAEMGVRWAADQMIVSHPIYWHTYFIAELIAHQTREAIEAEDGALLGNPKVRDFLMERYYRSGASVPWLEKIERATGKPLTGDAFFRYLSR